MKIIVLGAGVVGTTSAYYLAQQGHEVTVFERHSGAAQDTSFANAGQISPGYATPWAAPGVPQKAIKWLLAKHSPLRIRPDWTLAQLRWLWQMYQQCSPKVYMHNKERLYRIAEYSRVSLKSLRAQLNLNYDQRTQGTMQVFRSLAQLEQAHKEAKLLADMEVPHEILDHVGVCALEPGLGRSRVPIVGAMRLPNDETGDCQAFTTQLAQIAADQGVQFHYQQSVDELVVEGGAVVGVRIAGQVHRADAVVSTLGVYTPLMLKRWMRIPIYPVKGYSITVPVLDDANAPQSTILDETYKVALTRLGDRIRVGGMAELCGYNRDLPYTRRETLEMVLNDLFPNSSVSTAVNFWTGLRPVTPDSAPVLGSSPIAGLWLNAGHGTLGWTMACGSARVLADLMSGRVPEIESADFNFSRFA